VTEAGIAELKKALPKVSISNYQKNAPSR
jgi:hypothetical protein